MTSAVVQTYAETRGYTVGHCTHCGCQAMAKPGYPHRFNHVDRHGQWLHPQHKYNWFHTPVAVSRSAIVGLFRRVIYSAAYPWKRIVFHRKFIRAARWPEG